MGVLNSEHEGAVCFDAILTAVVRLQCFPNRRAAFCRFVDDYLGEMNDSLHNSDAAKPY